MDVAGTLFVIVGGCFVLAVILAVIGSIVTGHAERRRASVRVADQILDRGRQARERARSGSFKRYTRAELEALPVLSVGQADDLHVEDRSRGIRIWLSRDAPYVVEVEQLTPESAWVVMDRYTANDY